MADETLTSLPDSPGKSGGAPVNNAELQDSEGKIDEGIWAWDVPNNHLYWSRRLFEMLGLPEEGTPLTIKTVMALIHPKDRKALEKVIQTSLRTGNYFEAEFRIRHHSREYRRIRLMGRTKLNDKSKPIRISGLATDVTERKQAVESLREARKELADIRYALDESTILSITNQHGIVTYINEAFCRISQYSPDELIGEADQLINSGYSKAFFKEIWDTINSGHVWRGEIKNKAKDGTDYWVDTTFVPLLDTIGKPFQYIVVRHEITRQKEAEEEVRKLNKNLDRVEERAFQLEDINLSQRQELDDRKILEMELKNSLKREKLTKHLIQLMNRSFDVITILEALTREIGIFFGVDRCLIIHCEAEEIQKQQIVAQYCNSEMIPAIQEDDIPAAILDLPKGQPETEHPLILLNTSDPHPFPPDIQNYLKRHGVQSAFVIKIEYRHVSFGQLVLHQCRYPRIWTEQEVEFLEILSTHIGTALYQVKLFQQQKQLKQEAEEANRQKSKVLSFVAHDFKNPLASIIRFIDILEKDKTTVLSEKHRELIGYIGEGAQLLRNLVVDILDKARLAEGKIIPSLEWIELPSFIEQLRPSFKAMASPRKIKVHIDIEPELTEINADPTHLRQILINLISNAVKYNQVNGEIFLKLYKAEDEQLVVFEIRDTGLGIPEEKIPQLFTEFFRADLSESNPVEGTGLGLAFIKKLVELHGGSLTVESEVGIGSTFRATLPFAIN